MFSTKTYTSDLIHNSLIETYGFDIQKHYSSRLKFDLLKSNVRTADAVLDAGCANGLFALAIAHACDSICAIDINHKFLEVAEQKRKSLNINNIHFGFGDIENIPYPDQAFALVYSYSVLVLVANLEKAISEIARVTKTDGTVILDFTGRRNLSQKFWRKYYKEKGHFHFNALTLKEIEMLCNKNDLYIKNVYSLGFLDQWKYLPILSRMSGKLGFIEGILHAKSKDIDALVSNIPFLKPFANRWYVVCKKK